MRNSALLVAIGIATGALPTTSTAADSGIVFMADAAPVWLKHQSLNEADALTRLQHSNPRHYAFARRILAAANEICNATEGAALRTKFDAQQISCIQGLWLTSNPPKRALQFRIDDTVYSALVPVRDIGEKLEPAR